MLQSGRRHSMSLRVPPAGRLAALAVLLSALSLAGLPGRQRAPAVPSSEAAYLFLSPNTDEDLTLAEAQRRLLAPCQAHARRLAGDILDRVGAPRRRVEDALGDWSDGVENSLLVALPGAPDPATVRYAAAWFGLLADQKGVLTFHPAAAGPDTLAVLDVRADLGALRQALDRHGVCSRTIVTTRGGHRVVVCDQGGQATVHLRRLGRLYGPEVRCTPGTAAWVGEPCRGQARATYSAVIRAYEAVPGRPRYRPQDRAPAALSGCGPRAPHLAFGRPR